MKKFETINSEEMCVWVAPDGTPQPALIGEDMAMCLSLAEMFSKSGLVKSPSQMFSEGWQILPVKVTIEQNGTEEDAFQKMKQQIG